MAKPNNNYNGNKRMQVNNYEKEFDSFRDMVNGLVEVHPEIKNIFKYDDEEDVLPQYAAEDVTNYFLNNIPDVINRVNLPVSISVSANRVSLKTNKFFAIGWKFEYDENGFVTNLVARFSVFNRGKSSMELINILELRGWKVIEDNYEKKPYKKNYNNKHVHTTDNNTNDTVPTDSVEESEKTEE